MSLIPLVLLLIVLTTLEAISVVLNAKTAMRWRAKECAVWCLLACFVAWAAGVMIGASLRLP